MEETSYFLLKCIIEAIYSNFIVLYIHEPLHTFLVEVSYQFLHKKKKKKNLLAKNKGILFLRPKVKSFK